MSPTRAPAAPPKLKGFTHVSLLGTGGYADVYLYEQARPRRQVAVKVLLAAGLTDARRRQFTAEADLMAQVSAHPYIVNIFGADVADDGRPYLVMEYYPRPHLGARARNERISVPEVLRIGIQVSGAVESAHRLGILHRDIKPANLLTSQYGRPGLTDFGISASRGAKVEEDDRGGMSIPWTAPEVFRPETDPDERCDVYSLGATVWHMLVGHSPFDIPEGDNRPLALMRRIENDRVPATGRQDVPLSLERVLEQSMRKNPANRFPSAFDFARALQSVQQELSLGVTPIEIPDVDGAHSRPREDAGHADLDATRFKPTRIDAQTPSPRPNSAVPSQQQGQPTHNGADGEWVEGTIARPTASSQLPTAPKAPVATAPDREQSRKRLLALSLGGLALAAVAAIVAVLVISGDSGEGDPVVLPSRKPVPQEVTSAAFVAAVEGAAARISPAKVRFSWKSPDPEPGDFYVVTRTDSEAGAQVNIRLKTPSYEVETTTARPCLSVVLVRDSGQASEATVMCLET